MASDQHRAIVEHWMYDVFAQGNIVALDELLAPDFVSTDPSGRVGARGAALTQLW